MRTVCTFVWAQCIKMKGMLPIRQRHARENTLCSPGFVVRGKKRKENHTKKEKKERKKWK